MIENNELDDALGDRRRNAELELALAAEQQAVDGHLARLATPEGQSIRDEMYRYIGQFEMAKAVEKIASIGGTSRLKDIKERKLYLSLKGVQATDRNGEVIENVATWDGFCRAIGTSRQKADEDIANLEAFGETDLDVLSRAGLGYRELRRLRRLPEQDRKLVIEGIEADPTDPASVEQLLDEITEKHDKALGALKRKLTTAEQLAKRKQRDIDARDRELAELRSAASPSNDAEHQQESAETTFLSELVAWEEEIRVRLAKLDPARLEAASKTARVKAYQFGELIELQGRIACDLIRQAFPDLFGYDVPPADEELDEARSALSERREAFSSDSHPIE